MTRSGALLAALALLILPSLSRADFNSDSKGTASATFLEIAPSARSAALGQAYVAAAEGAEALFWNPAGMVEGGPTATAFLSEQLLVDGLTYQALAYSKPFGPGAIGVGLEHFSSGQINATDPTGLPAGTFSVSDFAGTLAGAWKFDFPLDAGFSAKYVSSQIATSASAFSMDGGLTWRMRDDWRVSAAARNVGGSLKFDSVGSRLPLEFDIGTARAWNSWLATLDVEFPVDNAPFLAAGTEYRVRFSSEWSGAARLGFNTLSFSDTQGLSNVSVGLGASYSSPTGEVLSVDYAFIPMGQLGTTNRFTVGLRFGLPELEAKYEQEQRKEQQRLPWAPPQTQGAKPAEAPYPDWGIWVPPPPKRAVPQELLKPESGAVPTSTEAIVGPLTPPPASTTTVAPATPTPSISTAPAAVISTAPAAVVSTAPAVAAPPAVSSAPAVLPAPIVSTATAVAPAAVVSSAPAAGPLVAPAVVSTAPVAAPPPAPAVSTAPAAVPIPTPAAPAAPPLAPAISTAPASVPIAPAAAPSVSTAPASTPPPPPKEEPPPLLPLPN